MSKSACFTANETIYRYVVPVVMKEIQHRYTLLGETITKVHMATAVLKTKNK